MTPVRFTEIVYMLPKNVLSSCHVLFFVKILPCVLSETAGKTEHYQ